MADAADGSVQTGNPEADGTKAKGSAEVTGWVAGLETGNQEFAKTKGWDDPNKVVASYKELESTLGNRVAIPGKDAKPEEREAFYTKLGRPEKPEGYEFKLPEGYPEGLPYDKGFADAMKGDLHKAGVPQDMADQIHGAFALQMAGLAEQQVKAVNAKAEAAHDALVKDWGPVESEAFKENAKFTNRALERLGLLDVFKAEGLILDDGAVLSAPLAQALMTVGKAMFQEDDLGGDREDKTSGGGKNPWKKGQENTQEQNRILRAAKNGTKADRDTAVRLIREAGKNPATYRLE